MIEKRWEKYTPLIASIGVILFVWVGMGIICAFTILTPNYIGQKFPSLITKPIEPSVAQDLCQILGLDINKDPRCQRVGYSIEFFPDLKNHYLNHRSVNELQTEIGKYAVACDRWDNTTDGYYRFCDFDFQGDRKYEFNVYYVKEEGQIHEVDYSTPTDNIVLGVIFQILLQFLIWIGNFSVLLAKGILFILGK